MQYWNYSSTEKVFIADLKSHTNLVSAIFSGSPTLIPTTPSSTGRKFRNLGPNSHFFRL